LAAFWFRHGDERFAGPHADRLGQVHPASRTHGRQRQQAQPLSRPRVDLEDRDTSPGLDAFQMEAGDDPVVAEPEGELPFRG
jgi:hypothetical protein